MRHWGKNFGGGYEHPACRMQQHYAHGKLRKLMCHMAMAQTAERPLTLSFVRWTWSYCFRLSACKLLPVVRPWNSTREQASAARVLACALSCQTHRYADLSLADFFEPLGKRDFYDAFGVHAEVSIRAAALDAFQLQEDDLAGDLLVSADAASARGWTDHKEQPVDQNLRNVPIVVISVNTSEVDS